MIIAKRKQALFEELKDKNYRNAFVAEHVNIGIPFQIRALREQKPWTQQELAEKAGKKQSWISKIENTNYRGFSLSTLLEIASVFDVGLEVRFVPLSELVEWELNLSNESLNVPSFEEDPYFKGDPLREYTQGRGRLEIDKGVSKVIDMISRKPIDSIVAQADGRQSNKSHGLQNILSLKESKRASALG